MSYLTHAINDSATLCGEAAGAIAPLTAVKFDGNGKLAPAGAGELCIGIALATTDDDCKAGDTVHVQIKEAGLWIAGGDFVAGDLLAADASGKAVKAAAGTALAIALEAGKANKPTKVLICRIAAA